jgi:hypothetical protein
VAEEAQLDLKPQVESQLWEVFSVGWDIASRRKKLSRKAKKAAWKAYLERLSRQPADMAWSHRRRDHLP